MSTRLFVFDLGTLKMDRNLLVENSILANIDEPNRPTEMVQVPISAYLVDHPDGRILFDTGCSPYAMGKNGRWPEEFQKRSPYSAEEECQLPNRLRQIGLGPEDIHVVVLSHMHNDHAGCVEFFGRSRLLVHEDEFAAVMQVYATGDDTTSYIRKDIAPWIEKSFQWEFIGRDSPDIRLNDTTTVLNLGPGHAYGMLGLHLNLLKTGGIVLCSDAIYCATNYGPPPRRNGIVVDSIGWDRTVRRVRKTAQATGSQVWFGHDSNQFEKLIKSTDGCYE
jgi:N-acyl homoserine lactone hydrolase